MGELLALTGLIFDSCPGKGMSYWQTFDAMVLSFPKTIAWRFLGSIAIHCFLIFLAVYVAFGSDNPIALWRRTPLEESNAARGQLISFQKRTE